MNKAVILKKGKGAFVARKHPWIFSGAIAREEGNPAEGDLVTVINHGGQRIATGHYQEGSIRVRILHYGATERPTAFWPQALTQAWHTRIKLGLVDDPQTTAFRLVHAAGDLLPGLIIDLYNQTAVVQCHSWGMYRELDVIIEGLREALGADQLKAVYLKSQSSLPRRFRAEVEDRYIYGEGEDTLIVLENGQRFEINLVTGQKTGFFLDQRDNRQLLMRYAKQARVLNTFCYSGGFSIYALQAGAAQVDSVDLSAEAMALCVRNVAINELLAEQHEAITGEVLPFLKTASDYDIVIVDPPAYAKSFSKRHQAVQGYKRLNIAAMARIRPGGLLFTFSCSQVVDRQLFQDTIVAAGLAAGRRARILHQLTQGPDHPVNLFHPEGSYLKGLVVQLD